MGWASEGSKYIGVAPISINSQGGIGLGIASPLAVDSSNNLSIPSSVSTTQKSYSDITYSADTTLTSDVYANNVTIDSGVTITTNGYNFFCQGTFTNNGTLVSGNLSSGSIVTSSYGGSGGGGGGNGTYAGNNGGSTLVAGGAGSTGTGGNGSTPAAPTLTTALINAWYINGLQNYLGSGIGGAGLSGSTINAVAGILIQANTLIAGTISTSGNSGGDNTDGGNGGSGGGVILLCYGSGGYTAGTYTYSGGAAGIGTGASVGNGGIGGDGQLMVFDGTPIIFGNFSYTASGTIGIINRISSYSYEPFSTSSTSTTSIISQSFTPQNSGLVTIKAVVSISNNTIGDGVEVGLYNGSTLLDSDGFTQEGLASNTHEITLYTEQLFTSPFSIQTYSIQINVMTGGTATAEIQQFEINEVF